MTRLVSVIVPAIKVKLVVSILKALARERDVFHLILLRKGQWVELKCKSSERHLERVLEAIETTGCGVQWGHIDVTTLALFKPAITSLYDTGSDHGLHVSTLLNDEDVEESSETVVMQMNPMLCGEGTFSVSSSNESQQIHQNPLLLPPRRKFRVSERMTIDEIAVFIEDGGRLTFNFLALVACASIIAGVGLLYDSATIVIASMLVSPLLGPILSITFGLAIWSRPIMCRGIRNECIGVIISFVIGMLMGFISAGSMTGGHHSFEMESRGQLSGLVAGLFVALASGFAVVLGITTGGINAIVGTAISISLLPPIVNSGIYLALSLVISHSVTATSLSKVSRLDLQKYSQVTNSTISKLLSLLFFAVLL
jgi:uncharacterized hydrophobic protein (TIGR00271 family)